MDYAERTNPPFGRDPATGEARPVYAEAVVALLELTEEQRLQAFSLFCTGCGAADPSCRCWDDE